MRRHSGFSLLEMVVTMSLILVIAALVVPCWGMVSRSRSKQVATSLIMESMERARQTAITKKSDVWLIFQHPAGNACDSLRIVARQDGVFSPLDTWQYLPGGITYSETQDSLMKERPPADLLLSAFNTQTPPTGSHFGAVMFQRTGRIGSPLPGGHPLSLGLSTAAVPMPESISLSRATGRATLQ